MPSARRVLHTIDSSFPDRLNRIKIRRAYGGRQAGEKRDGAEDRSRQEQSGQIGGNHFVEEAMEERSDGGFYHQPNGETKPGQGRLGLRSLRCYGNHSDFGSSRFVCGPILRGCGLA
jgi:hypothetical protein